MASNEWEEMPIDQTGDEWEEIPVTETAMQAEPALPEIGVEQPNLMDIPQEQPEQRGFGQEMGRQLGLTLRAGAEGIAETAGVFYDPLAALTNVFLPKEQQINRLYDQVHELLNKAGVPNPENQTERIVQQAAKLFTGAGAEAAAGAKLLQKGVTGTAQTIARGLAEKPVEQMTAAAAGGAAQKLVEEEGGGTLAQLGAGLLAGGTAAGIAGGKTTARTIQPGLEEAEKLGIDVMTSDVLVPRTGPKKLARAVGEMIPVFGTGPVRKKQYEQRLDAIKGVLRQFDAEESDSVSHLVIKSLKDKAQQDLTKYDNLKKGVISSLSNKGEMPLRATNRVIDREIGRLKKADPKTFSKLIDEIENWKTNLKSKTIQDIEDYRKDVIGEKMKSPDFVDVKSRGEKVVNKIYAALNQDMGRFIKDNGQRKDFLKWKIGNARISELIRTKKKTVLRKVLKDGEENTKAMDSIINSSNPSEMRLLFKKLPQNGKDLVRSSVLRKALSKSGQELDSLSADRFKQQLKKMGDQMGVYFKGQDLQKMEGLRRALILTQQSGESNVLHKTGYSTIPFIGGAALTKYFGGPAEAVVAAASAGMLARAIESKPVRDLAMRIPRLKEDPIEEAAAVERLIYAIGEQMSEGKQEQQQ